MKGRASSHTALLYLVASWILLTVTLAVWWCVHGLRQIEILSQLEPGFDARFTSQHRMMLGEGFTFIALLLIGGASLFLLLRREAIRNAQMKIFFATFTHELKTPLASLRLQAEALEEDLLPATNPLVERLLQDASRLELQMENALFLSTVRNSDQIHLEPVVLSKLVARLRGVFPDFGLDLPEDATIWADRRAIESIFKNLIQNARVHGAATGIVIETFAEARAVRLRVADNGQGFRGNAAALGTLFYRHTPQSGSGIGLHLSGLLLKRMQGGLTVLPSECGFAVELRLRRVSA